MGKTVTKIDTRTSAVRVSTTKLTRPVSLSIFRGLAKELTQSSAESTNYV